MVLPSFCSFEHLINRHNYGDWWERVQQSQICFLCFEEEAWLMWEGGRGGVEGVEGGEGGKWRRNPAESDNLTRQSNRQAQTEQILRSVNDVFQLKFIGSRWPREELQSKSKSGTVESYSQTELIKEGVYKSNILLLEPCFRLNCGLR